MIDLKYIMIIHGSKFYKSLLQWGKNKNQKRTSSYCVLQIKMRYFRAVDLKVWLPRPAAVASDVGPVRNTGSWVARQALLNQKLSQQPCLPWSLTPSPV